MSRRSLAFRLALMVPASVGFTGSASPAQADEPAELVTVHADGASGAAPPAPSASPLDAAQPTSVVGRTALDRYVASGGNYDDAVRLTPSVIDVSPNGPGLGEVRILTIRGFTDGQYNVTFDGIPFADSDDFTHHSSAYFVTRDLSSVSVDRGPGDATTIGDATFGGTVALRSVGVATTATVSPSLAFGSFATRSGGVRLDSGSDSLPAGMAGTLDAEAAQSDGALDRAAQRRGTVFGKLLVPLGSATTLTLVSNASRTVQNEPPGATRAEIAAFGPATALNDGPRSQAYQGYNSSVYHTDISYAAVDTAPTSDLSLSNTLYTYGLDRHFEQGLDPNGETPDGTSRGPGNVPGQSGRNGLRAWGDILRMTQALPAGLVLEAGLWIERQANSRSLIETDRTAGDVANPVLAAVPGVAGSAAIDRLQHEALVTLQPYAQLDWQTSPWLRLTLGLKGAWFDRAVSAPVMEGTRLPTRIDRSFGAALPDFSARAHLAARWTLYAQIARGFLAPQLQFFDVTAPASASFSPEQTWNFQIGTTWSGRSGTLSADLYEVLFDHAVGVRTVGGESMNYGEGSVTYRGIEAEGLQPLGFALSLYGSLSLNQAHQAGSAGGVSGPAPTTPQATFSTGLIFDHDSLSASLIEHWTGGSYGDVGRQQWIAPYGQLDASAGTTLPLGHAARIVLRAQLFNLLDSQKIDGLAGYTVASASPLYWTQAGRSVFGSATMTF